MSYSDAEKILTTIPDEAAKILLTAEDVPFVTFWLDHYRGSRKTDQENDATKLANAIINNANCVDAIPANLTALIVGYYWLMGDYSFIEKLKDLSPPKQVDIRKLGSIVAKACQSDKVFIVKVCVGLGFNINDPVTSSQKYEPTSPIIIAIKSKSINVIEFLITIPYITISEDVANLYMKCFKVYFKIATRMGVLITPNTKSPQVPKSTTVPRKRTSRPQRKLPVLSVAILDNQTVTV